MKLPSDIRPLLARRFAQKQGEWLITGTEPTPEWPWQISLGAPTERAALKQPEGVQAWLAAWRQWQGIGTLTWCQRRWQTLGAQQLPDKLVLQTPEEVVACLGETQRWQRANVRCQTLLKHWPGLKLILPRYFAVLADYSEADFNHLIALLSWLSIHPNSQLYPRQVPVPGISSKWLEQHQAILAHWLESIVPEQAVSGDFLIRFGLKPLPCLMRLRILDPNLRKRVGGLSDITAPWLECAALPLSPRQVFIVENLQTGLALPDIADTLVIMGLGYNVAGLAKLPWLQQAQCIYWGDLDTHGFAILSRARQYVSGLCTILMDEATLLSHQAFWGKEQKPHAAAALPNLTGAEQTLYQNLKQQQWGENVRLEQERIAWDYALVRLQQKI